MMARPGDGPFWHYPALVGCIGEARRGRPAELQRVAARILVEGLRGRITPSAYRAAILAARVALDGEDD